MPMITVDVAAAPDAGLTKKIVARITELTSGILGKDPQVTAIAVDYLPPRQWFVGGRSLEEIGKAAFFLDVRISDGSNTKDEKARFLAEAFAAMERLLGAVHPESYIHVDDARADAYGYGGLTQERRYVQGRPAPEPRR